MRLAIVQLEKYRPTLLRDVEGNTEAVSRLQVIADEGNMPNLILAVRIPSPSTIARALLGTQTCRKLTAPRPACNPCICVDAFFNYKTITLSCSHRHRSEHRQQSEQSEQSEHVITMPLSLLHAAGPTWDRQDHEYSMPGRPAAWIQLQRRRPRTECI